LQDFETKFGNILSHFPSTFGLVAVLVYIIKNVEIGSKNP
jgi:hypothetical protein